MKKIISLAALIITLIAPHLDAQKLSLEECVKLALENNAKMRTSSYELAASQETSKEAFTKYFPSVSISGAAFAANHGMLQHSFNLPLSMIIPDMPDMDFNIGLLKKGSVAGINLLQPIFLGGRLVNGNRLARVGEEVSRLQQRQSSDEVRQEVE